MSELRDILEELIQQYEQIDGNVLESVPNAVDNLIDATREKIKQRALGLLKGKPHKFTAQSVVEIRRQIEEE